MRPIAISPLRRTGNTIGSHTRISWTKRYVFCQDGDVLVGFVRTLSDGHLAANVEDVMVREGYRGGGVGEELMARLLREVGNVANVSLFCEPPVVGLYERSSREGRPPLLTFWVSAAQASEVWLTCAM